MNEFQEIFILVMIRTYGGDPRINGVKVLPPRIIRL
jgi:uncharacterized protein (DUF433 family)